MLCGQEIKLIKASVGAVEALPLWLQRSLTVSFLSYMGFNVFGSSDWPDTTCGFAWQYSRQDADTLGLRWAVDGIQRLGNTPLLHVRVSTDYAIASVPPVVPVNTTAFPLLFYTTGSQKVPLQQMLPTSLPTCARHILPFCLVRVGGSRRLLADSRLARLGAAFLLTGDETAEVWIIGQLEHGWNHGHRLKKPLWKPDDYQRAVAEYVRREQATLGPTTVTVHTAPEVERAREQGTDLSFTISLAQGLVRELRFAPTWLEPLRARLQG
jgi:hypothetical protein